MGCLVVIFFVLLCFAALAGIAMGVMALIGAAAIAFLLFIVVVGLLSMLGPPKKPG